MSKIAFIIENLPRKAEALFNIHKVTGLSISEIQRSINNKTTLVEYVLFMNDHAEIVNRLRNLLATLSQSGVAFRIFESNADTTMSSILEAANEIDANVLENILMSHEEGIKDREKLNELGHK